MQAASNHLTQKRNRRSSQNSQTLLPIVYILHPPPQRARHAQAPPRLLSALLHTSSVRQPRSYIVPPPKEAREVAHCKSLRLQSEPLVLVLHPPSQCLRLRSTGKCPHGSGFPQARLRFARSICGAFSPALKCARKPTMLDVTISSIQSQDTVHPRDSIRHPAGPKPFSHEM